MKMTVVVKKRHRIFNKSFVCEAFDNIFDNIIFLVIGNTSPNVDHVLYCVFSNVRTYEEVIWTCLSFRPLSLPFDAWKEMQSTVSVNSEAPQEEVVQ